MDTTKTTTNSGNQQPAPAPASDPKPEKKIGRRTQDWKDLDKAEAQFRKGADILKSRYPDEAAKAYQYCDHLIDRSAEERKRQRSG